MTVMHCQVTPGMCVVGLGVGVEGLGAKSALPATWKLSGMPMNAENEGLHTASIMYCHKPCAVDCCPVFDQVQIKQNVCCAVHFCKFWTLDAWGYN